MSPHSGTHDVAEAQKSSNAVPCQACRRRKIKCNRKRPCDFCSKASIPCQYHRSSTKPGLRAGYVQSLENRVASLEQEFQTFKQASQQSPSHSMSPPDIATHAVAFQAPDPSLPDAGSPNLVSDSAVLHKVCMIWFRRYHEWMPILHPPSILGLTEQHTYHSLAEVPIVLRALLLTLTTTPELKEYDLDSDLRDRLEKDIVSSCLSDITCENLQALIILATFVLAEGRMLKFWNLLALCKRVSTQLGLHDLVVNYCTNFEKTSLLPPRMLTVPSTDVQMEQHVRAYWTIVMLDSAGSIGVSWNLHVASPQPHGLSLCRDDEWDKPRGQIQLSFDTPSESLSSFALFVKFVNNELWQVHKFHQELCDLTDSNVYEQRKVVCRSIDARLIESTISYNLSTITAAEDSSGTITRKINHVLLWCVIDVAIITIYQRMIPVPSDSEVAPWPHAIDRCTAACDHLVSILREVSDEAIACSSPLLSALVFIAARFYTVLSSLQQAPVSSKAHFLIFVLQCGGFRWPLAARLANVLHAAINNRDSAATNKRQLPPQFWDFAYAWQDIDAALVDWSIEQA